VYYFEEIQSLKGIEGWKGTSLLGINSDEDKLQDVQKMNFFEKAVAIKMVNIEEK
jgi:hypothetical protein